MNTIIDFLSFRKQRVVLNKKVSKWTSVEAGVSQGSILGPLLFFIYINHLSDDLSTNAKLFADNTSLFSIVRDINAFNLDLSKQAQEVIFSLKFQKISHPSLYFNNNATEQVSFQKHLGMILDTKLNFQEHIKNILKSIKLLDC